jgi:hypothetical protein
VSDRLHQAVSKRVRLDSSAAQESAARVHQVQQSGRIQLHRAREPISVAARDDFGVGSIASEVFLAVSHRAGFWMV